MRANFVYDVIHRPLVTEKATLLSSKGIYVFEVDKKATKKSIANAVEKIFNTMVEKVSVLNSKSKVKFFKGTKGFCKSTRKAFVRLQKGCQIDVSRGVK